MGVGTYASVFECVLEERQIMKSSAGRRTTSYFIPRVTGCKNQDIRHQGHYRGCSSITHSSFQPYGQKLLTCKGKKHRYYLANTLGSGPWGNSRTARVKIAVKRLFLNGMGIAAAVGFNPLSINITVNATH